MTQIIFRMYLNQTSAYHRECTEAKTVCLNLKFRRGHIKYNTKEQPNSYIRLLFSFKTKRKVFNT